MRGRPFPMRMNTSHSPGLGSSRPAWASAGQLRPGVCVAGYLRAELGMGEHGRLVLAAVQEAGIEAGSFAFTQTGSRQEHPFEGTAATDLNVNIVVVNADQMLDFAAAVGPGFFDGRYIVGAWAWEVEEFPDRWPEAFALVDEIWANSEYSRRAIAAATRKPVYAFPLPIVSVAPRPGLGRADFGLPDGFLFLFSFDFLSLVERKNPLGVIQAFSEAFAPGEGPTLVLKAINGERCPADLAVVRRLVDERPDLMLLDGYLGHEQNAALVSICDCYVSLHRSEGFGLTMAEAMAAGKPVIATAYSGNLDFMDDHTAYLVPWSEGRVPDGCDPYPAGCRWAEPDLHAAAELMRRVVEHPEQGVAVGERAQSAVSALHGLAARAPFIRARYEEAQRVLVTRTERSGAARRGLRWAATAAADVTASTPYPPAMPSHPHPDEPGARGDERRTGALADQLDMLSLALALADVDVANRRVIDLTHRLIAELSEEGSLRDAANRLGDEAATLRNELDALRGSRAFRLLEKYSKLRRRIRR